MQILINKVSFRLLESSVFSYFQYIFVVNTVKEEKQSSWSTWGSPTAFLSSTRESPTFDKSANASSSPTHNQDCKWTLLNVFYVLYLLCIHYQVSCIQCQVHLLQHSVYSVLVVLYNLKMRHDFSCFKACGFNRHNLKLYTLRLVYNIKMILVSSYRFHISVILQI